MEAGRELGIEELYKGEGRSGRREKREKERGRGKEKEGCELLPAVLLLWGTSMVLWRHFHWQCLPGSKNKCSTYFTGGGWYAQLSCLTSTPFAQISFAMMIYDSRNLNDSNGVLKQEQAMYTLERLGYPIMWIKATIWRTASLISSPQHRRCIWYWPKCILSSGNYLQHIDLSW